MINNANEKPVKRVGPVLSNNPISLAIIAVIKQENALVDIQDRGSYFRVLAPGRCILTVAAISDLLGREFNVPADLESNMCSFSGKLHLTSEQIIWES